MKHLSTDYIKLSSKLNDLEELMKTMLTQINEKKANFNKTDDDSINEEVKGSIII
jgi:hypothetical protein